MKKIKNIVFLLLTFVLYSCSNSDEQFPQTEFERQLTDGYFIEGGGQSLQFLSDGTFKWMEKNYIEKFNMFNSPAPVGGKWRVEGNNIILDTDRTVPDNFPSILFNVSFVQGKMCCTDEKGNSIVLDNKQPSTFVDTEIYGHTFKSSIYALGDKIDRTLAFSDDGYVEWSLVQKNEDDGTVKSVYSAGGFFYTNLSKDEVCCIIWGYDDFNNIPSNEFLLPPYCMIDIRSEVGEDGEWFLWFNGGYSTINPEVRYVREN